ncbi:probable aspartic-type endopeptidase opsB [Aspergillus lentulus]|uniref:Probable aspartic-type endopeptidase opsB n=1 Tax=Aspergillus lentulus TaxID=293939 RepID=A0ABQ1AJK5_ASPLE|nr:probable aspartic-type endopeptidase opsB [Aspergillus lentulus]GFF83081.1 probable aspartic-type endopeptidase opsB [Aspergillus lentulus]GFF86565.1 probable aspartic-type endopeptidase opsB [Aspergillus lentulus]
MRKGILSLLSLAIKTSNAIALGKGDSPAVVELRFNRQRNNDILEIHRAVSRRDSILSEGILNEDVMTLYTVNVTVGTSEQEIAVVLDTGSSDTWFNIPSSNFCQNMANNCEQYGVYDNSSSRTYTFLNHEFNITYKDGTKAAGDYVKDTIQLGGVMLSQFQFGIAEESTSNRGTLGLGFPALEATRTEYPNFPQALVQAGHIKSATYSLWMEDVTSHSGTILFGGANAAKYLGQLQTIPLQPTSGVYTFIRIILTGLSLQQRTSNTTTKYPDPEFPLLVTIDSGASVTYLPLSLTTKIYSDLGVTHNAEYDVPVLPCSMKDKDITLTFDFSGIRIDVSIHELVLNGIDMDGDTVLCVFGIYTTTGGIPVLGDTFLRSTYVVFDLANREISMANTNFNPGEDAILEIGTGKDAVPAATPVPSPATTAVNMPTAVPLTTGRESSHGSIAINIQMDVKLLFAGLVVSLISVPL